MATVFASGAEAVLSVEERDGQRLVIKERQAKRYRHPALDGELRRSRTRREAKLLAKAPVAAPRLLGTDRESRIEMEFIEGEQLKGLLDEEPARAGKVGEGLAALHDAGIIHGDLTTSNLLLRNGELLFIDFGLGFSSREDEDKAVDIHLFRQALESTHHRVADQAYAAFLEGYRSSERAASVLERLAAVERRGRNKGKGR